MIKSYYHSDKAKTDLQKLKTTAGAYVARTSEPAVIHMHTFEDVCEYDQRVDDRSDPKHITITRGETS